MKRAKSSSRPEAASCEVCGAREPSPGSFVTCEGFLVCERCAKTHSGELARMRDALDAELRGS